MTTAKEQRDEIVNKIIESVSSKDKIKGTVVFENVTFSLAGLYTLVDKVILPEKAKSYQQGVIEMVEKIKALKYRFGFEIINYLDSLKQSAEKALSEEGE